MAKFNYPKNNFSIGEIAPNLQGRSDTATYANGAETIRNANILVGGGITTCEGTIYKGNFKEVTAIGYPVIINSTEYILEFGNLYMRVWKEGVLQGAPYEMVTPFTSAQVSTLSFAPNDKVIYVMHASHQPRKIIWTSDTSWSIGTIDMPVFIRPVGTESISITPSAVTNNITLTSSSALFTSGWIGRVLKINEGYCKITAYTNSTTVSATVNYQYAPHDGMIIHKLTGIDNSGSPTYDLDYVDTSPNPPDATIYFETKLKNKGTALFEAEIAVTPYQTGATRFVEYSSDDEGMIANATIIAKASKPFMATVKVKMDTHCKEPLAYSINTNANTIAGIWYSDAIELPLSSITADFQWTVKLDSGFGWPSTCCIHEQRLWFAGVAACPSTVFSSKSGDLEDYTAGVLADSACIFNISSAGTIKHLVSGRSLEVFTTTEEYTIDSTEGSGIKPTDVSIKQRTTYGTGNVKPDKIGSDSIFVPRGGNSIRQVQYQALSDQYESNELTAIASHIATGIVGIKFNRYTKTLYGVLSSGDIAMMGFDVKQGLQGWSRRTTEGDYKQVIVTKHPDGDRTYAVVLRNSSLMLELFSSTASTDSQISSTDVTPKTVWSGFDHLEGNTVDVIADGVYHGQQSVSSGDITLSRTATSVKVGLPYRLYVKDLPVDVSAGGSNASHIAVSEVYIRLLNTQHLKVAGQLVTPRQFPVQLDSPPPEFTGVKDVYISSGWQNNGQIEITQDVPAKATILGIYKKVTVND